MIDLLAEGPGFMVASLQEDTITASSITSSFSYFSHLSLLKFPIQINLPKRKGQKRIYHRWSM